MNYKFTVIGFNTNDVKKQKEILLKLKKDLNKEDNEFSTMEILHILREKKNSFEIETCFEGVAKQIHIDFEVINLVEIDEYTISEMEQRQSEYNIKLSYAENWYKSLDFVHKSYINVLIEQKSYHPPQ